MAMAVTCDVKRSNAMKTILLLNDEIAPARPQLANLAPGPMTARESEGTPGCNCDRWGHPCPGCVERNVQPKAELPVSSPAKHTG
jgi:hypothetical protein